MAWLELLRKAVVSGMEEDIGDLVIATSTLPGYATHFQGIFSAVLEISLIIRLTSIQSAFKVSYLLFLLYFK